mgnify:CR=1 FL=1
MLTIDGKKISLSKGDTFDVTFAVNGYRLQDGDSVMKKIYTTFVNNKVRVQISAEEMESLTIGSKVYDLVCITGDVKVTLNYPANLVIKEVVHNE